ncbi:hypothetical protein DAPPUDRAFT_114810 [Daphnia pulex]|uniref:Uncharacterized protein n=1 Tax=Daphnia pulex TaxID=6669 RepID=E9HJA9_DAPPU|nr:hypothetical protein DAPPUDRAFT_118631 [Daphnia pulex]EFX68177.1 hypothetical protein DAPPUDRAFT_114810 [Daphnia pulex]|eukprot:EFX63995.1 hypothetical protein DAPPUDRAFT_118631 [Daphnia pulex]
MSIDSFKSLLPEMLGPVLQASLVSLRLSLGQFYSGVRTALGLQSNQLLIYYTERVFAGTANEEPNYLERGRCRKRRKLRFVVVNRRLVGCFKAQNQQSTFHLLLPSTKLWCDFVNTNYPHRLMSLNSSDSLVQMQIYFRTCMQPFGRLLASFDIHLNGPLKLLLDRVAKREYASQEIKEAYFLDWFLLRIPPHLNHCLKKLPLSKMSYIVYNMFEDPKNFFIEWEQHEGDVIDGDIWGSATGRMRNWTFFTKTATRSSLASLASSDSFNSQGKSMQAVSSNELPRTPKRLFEKLTELVVTSILWPRFATGNQARRFVRQANLHALLKSTSLNL